VSLFNDIKNAFLGPQPFDGEKYIPPGKAVFVSPAGDRIPFDFGDVSSAYASKAAVFENAVGDGTYVQPNGHTSGRFPLACVFSGSGYDDRAQAFIRAVLEPGVGVLSHPQYRRPIDVVPVGDIERTDAFVSGAGEAIVSLVWYETTGLQLGGISDFDQSFDGLQFAAAADFSDKLDTSTLGDAESFGERAKSAVKKIKSAMATAQRVTDAVTGGVDAIGDSISRGIDLLVGQPLTMAHQFQLMLGEPARTRDLARDKLRAYGAYAASLFGVDTAERQTYTADLINNFHLNQLLGKTAIGNMAKLAAAATDQFTTREDLIAQAEELADLLDRYETWHDTNYAAIAGSDIRAGTIDTGGGLLDLTKLVSLSMSALITSSLTAKTRMAKEIESDRTPLDLCFKLYGTTEWETLDLFYATNDLGGDEYFIIPKGRRIVWYV